jgi:hypothetical protein
MKFASALLISASSGCGRKVASDCLQAQIPPLASHGLRCLQPFRAERRVRKHEAELRVLALVLQAWSLTESV